MSKQSLRRSERQLPQADPLKRALIIAEKIRRTNESELSDVDFAEWKTSIVNTLLTFDVSKRKQYATVKKMLQTISKSQKVSDLILNELSKKGAIEAVSGISTHACIFLLVMLYQSDKGVSLKQHPDIVFQFTHIIWGNYLSEDVKIPLNYDGNVKTASLIRKFGNVLGQSLTDDQLYLDLLLFAVLIGAKQLVYRILAKSLNLSLPANKRVTEERFFIAIKVAEEATIKDTLSAEAEKFRTSRLPSDPNNLNDRLSEVSTILAFISSDFSHIPIQSHFHVLAHFFPKTLDQLADQTKFNTPEERALAIHCLIHEDEFDAIEQILEPTNEIETFFSGELSIENIRQKIIKFKDDSTVETADELAAMLANLGGTLVVRDRSESTSRPSSPVQHQEPTGEALKAHHRGTVENMLDKEPLTDEHCEIAITSLLTLQASMEEIPFNDFINQDISDKLIEADFKSNGELFREHPALFAALYQNASQEMKILVCLCNYHLQFDAPINLRPYLNDHLLRVQAQQPVEQEGQEDPISALDAFANTMSELHCLSVLDTIAPTLNDYDRGVYFNQAHFSSIVKARCLTDYKNILNGLYEAYKSSYQKRFNQFLQRSGSTRNDKLNALNSIFDNGRVFNNIHTFDDLRRVAQRIIGNSAFEHATYKLKRAEKHAQIVDDMQTFLQLVNNYDGDVAVTVSQEDGQQAEAHFHMQLDIHKNTFKSSGFYAEYQEIVEQADRGQAPNP